MDEFGIIDRYFNWHDNSDDLPVSIGDDAAVINIPAEKQLVTCIDTLISGVHFPETTSAHAIAYKSLAVNLSDIAAMGASPKWFTLAITLPEIDPDWLKAFSSGLKTLADHSGCYLIGGDTTRGPLSISIQILGLVEKETALLRSQAQPGDRIYVSGTLGDAALGLKCYQDSVILDNELAAYCINRLNYPTPRLELGRTIRDKAHACIDVSDGLLQDLSHILDASGVGATLDLTNIPLSKPLQTLDRIDALRYALTGGDDYELLFTLPKKLESWFMSDAISEQTSCIGVINNKVGSISDTSGNLLTKKGYNHFS